MSPQVLSDPDLSARIQRLWDNRAETRAYVIDLLEIANSAAQSDASLAIVCLQEACAVAGRLRDLALVARARTRLAWQTFLLGKLDQTLLQASYAELVARQTDANDVRRSAVHMIALVRHRIGDFTMAENLWRELLGEVQKAADKGREADYLHSIASVYLSQKRYLDCLKLRLQAHRLYESLNDPLLSTSANNIAHAYLLLRRPIEADAWATLAIERCQPGQTIDRAIFLHSLGQAQAAGGSTFPLAAHTTLLAALESLRQGVRDPHVEAMIRVDLGKACDALGDTPRALEEIEAALSLATKARSADEQMRAHHALHEIYTRIGAFEEALKHCNGQVDVLKSEKARQETTLASVLAAAAAAETQRARWHHEPLDAAPAC